MSQVLNQSYSTIPRHYDPSNDSNHKLTKRQTKINSHLNSAHTIKTAITNKITLVFRLAPILFMALLLIGGNSLIIATKAAAETKAAEANEIANNISEQTALEQYYSSQISNVTNKNELSTWARTNGMEQATNDTISYIKDEPESKITATSRPQFELLKKIVKYCSPVFFDKNSG